MSNLKRLLQTETPDEFAVRLQELRQESPVDESKIARALQMRHLQLRFNYFLRFWVSRLVLFLIAAIAFYRFRPPNDASIFIFVVIFWIAGGLFEIVAILRELHRIETTILRLQGVERIHLEEFISDQIDTSQSKGESQVK